MKISKRMLVLCVVVFIFGTISCGGGKYADVKKAAAESNQTLTGFLKICHPLLSGGKDVVAELLFPGLPLLFKIECGGDSDQI